MNRGSLLRGRGRSLAINLFSTGKSIYNIKYVLSYDAQHRKRALMGRFSHFQFLKFFNRYMFKLLICVLFVRKLYTSVLKYGFV